VLGQCADAVMATKQDGLKERAARYRELAGEALTNAAKAAEVEFLLRHQPLQS
jgi:hypothetical protein